MFKPGTPREYLSEYAFDWATRGMEGQIDTLPCWVIYDVAGSSTFVG